MRSTCVYCEEPVDTVCPYPMCRDHAIEFFAGVVAIGAATSRVHREAPGNVNVVDVACTQTMFASEVLQKKVVEPGIQLELLTCRTCPRMFERAVGGRQYTLCKSCRHVIYKAAQQKGVQSRAAKMRVEV